MITAELREELFNEAVEYVQANDPCDPRDRKFALASYNDAHAGETSGERGIIWFDSEKDLLESIPGFLLVLNAGPDGPLDCSEISKNLARVVSAHWLDEIPRSQAIGLINELAADWFQVEWWGTREALLFGDEKFPKELRTWWSRRKNDADDSQLKPDEVADFLEYLSCDYMT